MDLAGSLYVADTFNDRVVRVTPGGNQAPVGSGFAGPAGVTVDPAGNLYVADSLNNRVVKVTLSPAASSSGRGSATVTWAAPLSDGGAAITGYTVTAADLTNPANDGKTFRPSPATATTCAITGLTVGDSYTFTVTAANAAGTGPASNPSNPVTVLAPPPVA